MDGSYLYLIIIIVMIVIAYSICKFFEIDSIPIITVMLVILITSFYAFGIVPFEFLGIGYLIFAVLIYSQMRNGGKNKSE